MPAHQPHTDEIIECYNALAEALNDGGHEYAVQLSALSCIVLDGLIDVSTSHPEIWPACVLAMRHLRDRLDALASASSPAEMRQMAIALADSNTPAGRPS